MTDAQAKRWSKTRTKGFFRYVILNTVLIVTGIFTIKFILVYFVDEQVSLAMFVSERLIELTVTALLLPFLYWGSWLSLESKYKKKLMCEKHK